ncbi:MAG: PfkB family carbohydrate kinase, partial [Rhodothermales bacterium]
MQPRNTNRVSLTDETGNRPVYLVAGHTTLDRTDSGTRLGGTVVYSTLAAAQRELTTRIVTAYGADLSPDVVFQGVEFLAQPSRLTTTFINHEQQGIRSQWLEAQGDPLRIDSVRDEWRNPDILHLAPVFREIDIEFASWFKPRLRCATLQGWMRSVDPSGQVIAELAGGWKDMLNMLDIAVYSVDDIEYNIMWREAIRESVRVSVETHGRGGCLICEAGREHHIAAVPADLTDSTGAGDIFATAYFSEYYRSGDAVRAGHAANEFTREMLSRGSFRDVLSPLDSSRSKE